MHQRHAGSIYCFYQLELFTTKSNTQPSYRTDGSVVGHTVLVSVLAHLLMLLAVAVIGGIARFYQELLQFVQLELLFDI